MKKFFRNKKTRYLRLFLIVLPIIIAIGVLGFFAVKNINKIISSTTGEGTKPVVSDSYNIDSMDYHLRSSANDYQKELFAKLKSAVENGDKTDEEMVELVVANFVADFYTWTNKAGSYDIGGMYYVYSPSKNNIYFEARNKFYKYVSYYIDKYGKENLLEVVSVTPVCGEASTREYDGETFDTYFVTCDWEYADHPNFSNGEYLTHMYYIVAKNADGRFEIMEAFED